MVHRANAQMNRRLLWDDLLVYRKGKPCRETISQKWGDDVLPEKYEVYQLELSDNLRMLSPTLYVYYRYTRQRRVI
jgi:hypothetical protein